jgi:aryl-alcohol dehydrogenase-like predicted oxidoreductase
MDYVTLKRTGLKVSVAGLGCGGFSRLGLGTGKTEADAVKVIGAALDLGVNYIDTAPVYGTEHAVGLAIRHRPRETVVISTKAVANWGDKAIPAAEVVSSIDNSLRELGTEYIDIFMLHGVAPAYYAHARDVVLPALERVKQAGKIRHIGITETAPQDPGHEMLARALEDDHWDVAMVAFHMMHQNARQSVLPAAVKHGVGIMLMFAVRRIFAQPERLAATMRELVAAGKVPRALAGKDEPLDFLIHPGGAQSLTDAAYRYARHEPGVDVVLFGTGSTEHLKQNIDSLLQPPLPQIDQERLRSLFSHLVGVGLDRPGMRP